MISSRRTIDDGPAGITETLRVLTSLKQFYGSLPTIRDAAIAIAGTNQDNDETGMVDGLARFVRRFVVYLADPINAELIQTPEVMLRAIDDNGRTWGDCDDHCLLFASLCEAAGVACDIAGVSLDGRVTPNHVICVAHLPSGPAQIDLCAKLGPPPLYQNLQIESA